jgi:hypothetical protein
MNNIILEGRRSVVKVTPSVHEGSRAFVAMPFEEVADFRPGPLYHGLAPGGRPVATIKERVSLTRRTLRP